MKNLLSWLKNEESGQGMVEYGLIIGLVAIVAIVILITMGNNIKTIFTHANSALSSAAAEPTSSIPTA